MNSSFHEIKKKSLQRQLAERIEEYEAVQSQLSHVLDPSSRTRLERQAREIEDDIRRREEELRGLAKPPEPEGSRLDKLSNQPEKLLPLLADVLQVAPEHNGRPYKAGPAQWWIRLQVESNQSVPECRGQLYNIFRLENEEATHGEPLSEAQATILSWADNKFTTVTVEPHAPQYLDLAWRAHGDAPIPLDELRVASSREEGIRDTQSSTWGHRQDFIPLKPGYYLFVVRFWATGFKSFECKYRLHWPGAGEEDNIRLTQFAPPNTVLKQSDKTAPISAHDLHQRTHKALSECGEFDSNSSLLSLFSHDKLSPWRNSIPQSSNKHERVIGTMAKLKKSKRRDGRNGLALLLEVLRDGCSEELVLHQELDFLAHCWASHNNQ